MARKASYRVSSSPKIRTPSGSGILDRGLARKIPILYPDDTLIEVMGLLMVFMLAYTAIFTAYQVRALLLIKGLFNS